MPWRRQENCKGCSMQIRNNTLVRIILWFQGIYTILTAIWALVHIKSFMWISGWKTDVWLVKTVSVLLICISIPWLMAACKKKYSAEVITLSVTCAIGLAAIEFYYSVTHVISPVYAMDGALQLVFLIAWIFSVKFNVK